MVPRGQSVDRREIRTPVGMALCVLAVMPLARAGDDALARPSTRPRRSKFRTPLNLVLTEMARKRNRKPDNIESHSFLDLTPGLNPLIWPKNSDVRARIVTPEIKARRWSAGSPRTCIAARTKTAGASRSIQAMANTCVFYRFHPKR